MKKMRQKNENSTCAVLKSSTKVAAADTASSHKANFHIVQSLSKKFHNSRKTSFYYIAYEECFFFVLKKFP